MEHIPCSHIAYSIDLLCVHGYKFVNFRKIVEMLLSCTGDLGDKSTLHPDVARTSKIFCCINN